MKSLQFLVVLLTVCAFPLQTAADDRAGLQALPVVLKERVSVAEDHIRLGDLFTGLDEESDRKTVAPAPALGKEAVLTAEWLNKLAETHGVAWKAADAKVSVTVRREAAEISKEEITRVIVKELTAQGMPENAELTFRKGDFPVLVPVKSAWRLEVASSDYAPSRQRFEAKLNVIVDDETKREIDFAGKAEIFVLIPVAARDLKVGQIITPDDVLTKRVSRETARDADPEGKAGLIGKEVKKSVRSGQQITQKDVRAQVMVAKGKIVTLNFTKGGIMLGAQGKALENGGLGDTVRVMNTQSKTVVQGTVTGPETVSVHAPANGLKGGKHE